MKPATPARKIRVLIVEDSQTIRQLLEHVISCDPRLELACSVESGEEALRVLDRVAPDVISMDIRLPGMNGLETTQRIMTQRPTPVVVVSASAEQAESQIGILALRAGALAVLEKPRGISAVAYQTMAAHLLRSWRS
jgi:two-component system chemotaxis response regulator CheB